MDFIGDYLKVRFYHYTECSIILIKTLNILNDKMQRCTRQDGQNQWVHSYENWTIDAMHQGIVNRSYQESDPYWINKPKNPIIKPFFLGKFDLEINALGSEAVLKRFTHQVVSDWTTNQHVRSLNVPIGHEINSTRRHDLRLLTKTCWRLMW